MLQYRLLHNEQFLEDIVRSPVYNFGDFNLHVLSKAVRSRRTEASKRSA